MKPTMLVSGGDTPLGNSIVRKALSSFDVAATTSDLSVGKGTQRGKDRKPRDESGSPLLIPWARQSAVSARNVVLQTIESYECIDQAVILHSAIGEKRILHELPLSVIEQITDEGLKSDLFLLREIVTHFLKRGSGVLALVVDRGGSEELATLDALVTEGFVALAKSLMSTYRDGPITISAFESASSDPDSYAEFILSTSKDCKRSGRWFSFGDRGRILRGGFRSKTKR